MSLLSKSVGDWSLHNKGTRVQLVTSLTPSDKAICHFPHMDNPKRKLTNKDESAVKKSGMLEVKFESNVNGVTEQIAGPGNVDTAMV